MKSGIFYVYFLIDYSKQMEKPIRVMEVGGDLSIYIDEDEDNDVMSFLCIISIN